MLVITPQNPLFYETLEDIDLFWQFHKDISCKDGTLNIVVDTQTGLLKSVDSKGFEEYIMGGEFDEQLNIMDEQDIINEICGVTSDFSPHILIDG